ncbi:MAG: tetratricopeptide repeat protein [Deltaproteobacteria bacterium]|nr:MAG: tetratricopeptide repeat protein [Deltaproteobacteria bacterium]
MGLRWLGCLALAMAFACGDGAQPSARNVLLITIDTLRADALGAYGSARGASPHLDELAKRGVVFEQAHASSPNTLPSHASILTGLQPYHHRVRENGVDKLAEQSVTLAERLRDAGYATGAEVAAIVLNRPTGIAQGFEHFRDLDSPGVQRKQIAVAADGSLHDPSAVDAQQRGDAKTFDLDSRGGAEVTRDGITFLREHRSGPFFLWLHYYDPHWPYAPPTPFESRFADDRYAGEIAFTDESVARVIAEVDQLGLGENTLVVVTGDHGEGLGDHGESRHSLLVYQSTMHVPLVFAGPGVPRGQRVAAPVQTVDIAPTILAWAGLEPDPAADGVSLLPAFEGHTLPDRPVYGESVSLRRFVEVSPLRFVREGRWKLIHKIAPELYDLVDDPAEAHNLAGAEPARAEQLREKLKGLLANRRDAPEAPNGELDPDTQRRLESLGYVVGSSSSNSDPTLDTIEVRGVDPTPLAAKIDPFVDALGATQFVDAQETAALLEKLSRELPKSTGVLEVLINVQLAAGQAEAAVESLRRGIGIDPDQQRYWTNLGELLTRMGRNGEARDTLTETLRRWPCELGSRTHLANVYSRAGARAKQIAVLEQGIEQCSSPALMNDLAYQLATVPAAELRDGKRALQLAESMIGSLGDNPLALDTLAVAQAEAGRRHEARATLAQALAMAERQKLPDEALRILREHAAKVDAGEAIRE